MADVYPELPIDLVERGAANPNNLNPDTLYRGVLGMSVWSHHLSEAPDGRVLHATPDGTWEMPAGLVLSLWTQQENGRVGHPCTVYVDRRKGIQLLRLDQDGRLPHDVTERMTAEAESLAERQRLAESRPGPTRRITLVRRGGYFLPPYTPELRQFTRDDRAELLATLRHEDAQTAARAAAAERVAAMRVRAAERVAKQGRLGKLARNLGGLAAWAASAFGKPTGRHSQARFA